MVALELNLLIHNRYWFKPLHIGMSGRLSAPLLVFLLMVVPFLPLVEAEGREAPSTSSLEAREISVSFNSNESTTISWKNLETNDYILLDTLNESTYEIYRSTSPLNSSNLESMTPIANGLEACLGEDDYSTCSGKSHEYQWQSPPGTEGTYYYGVVTNLPNGSIIADFNSGHSQSMGVWEDVHPIWAPLRVSAEYNPANSSTTIHWVNADEVGLDVPSNRTIWVWRHLVPIAGHNWDDIDSSIVATLSHDATSFIHQHVGEIEEEAYYSVTYRYDTWEDSRFIGTNTLLEPIREDNVAPELFGQLQATFNPTLGVTNLSWEGGVLEENFTIQVWRSSSDFSSLSQNGVELLAELPYNTTTYDHHLVSESNGEFWYAITLKDEVGNRISNLNSANPIAGPIHETNIGTVLTVPSGLIVESKSSALTTISWDPVPYATDAIYDVWMSTLGEVTESCLNSTCSKVVSTNGTTAENAIPMGIERDTWYAVTVVATWAQSTTPYQSNLLISGRNTITSSILEDTKSPSQVNDLSATFDGSTRTVSFTWSAVEENSTYQIWRRAGDWSSQTNWNLESSDWEVVKSTSGIAQTISSNYTLSASNTDLTATYAVSVSDQSGNSDLDLNPGAVILVDEDMLTPSLLLGIVTNESESPLEQTWLTNGMSTTFHGVPVGMSHLTIRGGEQLSEVSCRLLGNQSEQTSPYYSAELEVTTWKCELDLTAASMTMEIKALDTAGNPSYVVLMLKSVGEQSLPQSVDDTHDDLNDGGMKESASSELKSENDLLRMGFLVLAVLLFIVVILMLVKNREPKTPEGLPSKAEDRWADRFVG